MRYNKLHPLHLQQIFITPLFAFLLMGINIIISGPKKGSKSLNEALAYIIRSSEPNIGRIFTVFPWVAIKI